MVKDMKFMFMMLGAVVIILIICSSCAALQKQLEDWDVVGKYAPKTGAAHLCRRIDGMKHCYSVRKLKPKKLGDR